MIVTGIREGKRMAFFRLPGAKEIHFIIQEDNTFHQYDDLSQLNGKSGYVVAPFSISKNSPLFMIESDRIQTLDDTVRSSKGRKHIYEQQRAPLDKAYQEQFKIFMQSLQEKQIGKLVLSRIKTRQKAETLSIVKAFYDACRYYPRCYVYLLHTPETGIWMGASPELLLSGTANEWHTVALAGTQPLLPDRSVPQQWSEKDRKEQDIVAEYIRKQLTDFGVNPTELGPYPVRAGALAHLKTDFYFTMSDNHMTGDLLKLLHPTPAVCGFPKEEAFRFIQEHETIDRKYYSGFAGVLNMDKKTDLYVNLRCVEADEEQLRFYAGGGILPTSNINDEWNETEDKIRTMYALFK